MFIGSVILPPVLCSLPGIVCFVIFVFVYLTVIHYILELCRLCKWSYCVVHKCVKLCVCFLLSDLKVKVGDQSFSAHKFVLAARSDVWSLANLASTAELDLSGKNRLRPGVTHWSGEVNLVRVTVIHH